MTEDVIQFIWRTQSFNNLNLLTTDQESVVVYQPGTLNDSSGPDFSQAKIRINEVVWSGDVEIHCLSSQWIDHGHDSDVNYDKVILHVVWEEDKKIKRMDGSFIPTLVLKFHLDEDWYERYSHFMSSLSVIPCENHLNAIEKMIITEMIQSALIQRLEAKSLELTDLLINNKGDWERTAIDWLIIGFGLNRHKAAFHELVRHLDIKIIRKINSTTQMEAYFFGTSGLLPQRSNDEYVIQLRQEYNWLRKKYNIESSSMSISWWKFMRTRPANFPTRRLAQAACYLTNRDSFLRTILEFKADQLVSIFRINHSEFWRNHYHFNAKTDRQSVGLGLETQRSLLINVVAVLLVAYGKGMNQPKYISKAVTLLESLKSESNRITRYWQGFNIIAQNSSESQGLIELFNNYCKKSRCLSCSIGEHILQPK